MKAGTRAVGVAESYAGARSTLGGAVVRADRVADGFAFASCTVGGTDATRAVVDVIEGLDREDLQYVFVAGIAPAWYNLLDLPAIDAAVDPPIIAISFEASPGLERALAREFSGADLDDRLEIYRRQPARHQAAVNGDTVFVRSVGLEPDRAVEVVRAFTPEGGRPEPLRVARLAARAADRWRSD